MNDEPEVLQADAGRAFDGHYQLGSEIASGKRGVVYRGVDEKLDSVVAIKVWHARFTELAPEREEYDAEARALTALEHPNLVDVADYGIAGQAPYLVMELLRGETLEQRMRSGPLDPAQAQTFMQCVLRALGYMHMRGVVHRNLKPDNVFLQSCADGSEQVKLLDFGLESLAQTSLVGGPPPLPGARSVYEAPEQVAGEESDGRSDVYAAGVLMLHMLAGGEPTLAALRAYSNAETTEDGPRLLSGTHAEVEAFIARAVAPNRQERFGNADQMLRALLELPTPWLPSGAGAFKAVPPIASKSTRVPPPDAIFEEQDSSTFSEAELAPVLSAEPAPDPDEASASDDNDNDDSDELTPQVIKTQQRSRRLRLAVGSAVAALGLVGAAFALRSGDSFEQAPSAHASLASAPADKSLSAGQTVTQPERSADLSAVEHVAPQQPVDAAEDDKPHAPRVEPQVAPSAQPEPEAAVHEGPHAPQPIAEHASSEPAVEEPRRSADPVHRKHSAAELPQPLSAAVAAGRAEEAQPQAADHGAESEAQPAEPVQASSENTRAHASAADEVRPHSGAVSHHSPADGTPDAADERARDELATEMLGARRHVRPDQAEIRQMLGFALAEKPRTAARNPWKVRLPDALVSLREAIAHGAAGTANTIKTLRQYNADNPDTVYGHLLLAELYANRGWSLDALDQYDMAYQIDPSSRGAPEMIAHALRMVVDGIASGDAERFIERAFARSALPSIARELRTPSTSAAAVRRLRQLQARLARNKRR